MEQLTNSPVCRIEMLGGLSIYVGERLMPPLPKRVSSVIAYIALRLERGSTRDILIEQFWPESDPQSQLREDPDHLDKDSISANLALPLPDWQKNGRNSLSNALSEVRKYLKATGIAPDLLLIADRYEVRLNRDFVTTDVLEFEALLSRARNIVNDKAETLRLIADAAELYRGPLLNGFDEYFIEGDRQRLKDLFISAARHLVRDRVESKDLRSAIEYARRAVNEGPDTEAPYFDLIQLLMHTKQFGAARKTYQEMDLAVGPVSNRVALLLPKIDAELEAQRSRSSPIEEMGDEASHSIDTIPFVWTRFIGRNAALHDLTELLTDPQTRLVTIFGMGGSGKTRLALELASRMQARFSGQVWFVPLVNVTDPMLLPRAIADALHLPPSDSEDPLAQAVAHLSRQEALLILDNFEHMVESGAAVIARLIAELPTVKLLVTSRRLMDLTAELAFRLPLMEVPGDEAAISVIQQCESVQLFIDRARARQPGYSLTNHNAGAIAALCNRLEGIPLAIELAAARIPVLAPEQMIIQLRDRFRLLTTSRRDVDERHRSLLATLEWSFRLLEPELQKCLSHLSVFRGGWTIEAAAAVNQSDALEQLMQFQHLLECSLLQTEHLDDHVRFHMLETVRQFASLNLNQHDVTQLQQRHLDYFLEFVEAFKPQLQRVDAIVAIERLDVDIENIRFALAYGSSDSGCQEKALRLATVLYAYWKHRGLYREGRRWLEVAIREDIPITLQVRADALHHAGALALLQGDYSSAATLFGTCLDLRRTLDNAGKIAETIMNLGIVSFHLQQDERASALFEEVASIHRELQDWQNLARVVIWQANAAQRRGDLEAVQRLLSESLGYYELVGSAEGHVLVLNNLGALAHDQGYADRAVLYYEECLSLLRKADNRAEIARTLNNYGNALRDLGRLTEAVEALTESLALWQVLENLAESALTLVTLGLTQCAQKDLSAALESFSSSWRLSLTLNDRTNHVFVLLGLAEVALIADQPMRAALLLAQAQRSIDEHAIELFPSDRRDWDRILTQVKCTLTVNEFEEAWRTGYAVPQTQSFPIVVLPHQNGVGLRP